MQYVDLVAMLAVLQYLAFGGLVARAREKHGLKAPAVTGCEPFERAYRVQMNTLELLVALLPALYIASKYWSATYAAIAGAVYIGGRFVYWRAYVHAPERRQLGFVLSLVPIMVLVVAGFIGWLTHYSTSAA